MADANSPVWVKICGIQTMKAAVAACEAGTDAVGFILAPARRQVSEDRLQALILGLPPGVVKVGVFVNSTPAEMQRIADYAGLTAIQMHGAEPPEYIDAVKLPVIKAFRIKDAHDLDPLPDYRRAAAILLDPYVEGKHGGTGRTIDWALVQAAKEVLAMAGVALSERGEPLTPGRPRLILAGGLTPESVAEAIRQAHPGGVDVSSGVETDGQKDINKIYDFVDLAKGALE